LALDGNEWLTSCPGHFTARGKDTCCALSRRLGLPWSWFGHFAEEKYPLILMKIRLSVA